MQGIVIAIKRGKTSIFKLRIIGKDYPNRFLTLPHLGCYGR